MINKTSLIKFFKTQTLREVLFVYFGSIVNGVSLFLVTVLLGNHLTKNDFGIFTLSVMVLTVTAELSDFGLNAGLLRFGPQFLAKGEEESFKKFVKTIWHWRVKISLLLTLGGLALAYPLAKYIFKQPEIYYYLLFSFIGIGGTVLLGFINSYLQTVQKFKNNSQLQIVKGLSKLLLIALFVFTGSQNLYLFLAVFIFTPWLIYFYYFKFLPAGFNRLAVSALEKKDFNSRLGNFSLWLTINHLFAIVAGKIDQVVVSNYLGLEQLAIFSIAMQFLYFYSVGIGSITSVITPKINALLNKDQLRAYIIKSYKAIVPLFLAGIFLIYPTKFFIILLFGAKYVDSIPAYLILSYSMLFSLAGVPLSSIMIFFNKPKLIALLGFVQLAVNLGANLYLIPRYGIIGASLAYGVGVLFSLLYTILISTYLFKSSKTA
ncbi:MAG: oligosaccharide flippase family protein [bacterium]